MIASADSARADPTEKPDERGSSWFIRSGLRRTSPNSPQPYRRDLADMSDLRGHEDMADHILFASRERELLEKLLTRSRKSIVVGQGRCGKMLGVLKYLIGYGYGWGELRALIWSTVLIGIGTFILYWKKEEDKYGIRLGFWYSLDMLLPIIHLRERHYTDVDLKTRAKYYFYIHKIMGYVLISFVIAGLSGLVE